MFFPSDTGNQQKLNLTAIARLAHAPGAYQLLEVMAALRLGLPFLYALVFALSGKPLGSRNEFIKLSGRHLQSIRNPHDAFKRDGSLRPFDPADLVGLEIAKLRQLLL